MGCSRRLGALGLLVCSVFVLFGSGVQLFWLARWGWTGGAVGDEEVKMTPQQMPQLAEEGETQTEEGEEETQEERGDQDPYHDDDLVEEQEKGMDNGELEADKPQMDEWPASAVKDNVKGNKLKWRPISDTQLADWLENLDFAEPLQKSGTEKQGKDKLTAMRTDMSHSEGTEEEEKEDDEEDDSYGAKEERDEHAARKARPEHRAVLSSIAREIKDLKDDINQMESMLEVDALLRFFDSHKQELSPRIELRPLESAQVVQDCARWAASRDIAERRNAAPLEYSIASTVPALHAGLWKQVLMHDAKPWLEQRIDQPRRHLVIFPSSQPFALQSIQERVKRIAPGEDFAFSRLVNSDMLAWPLFATRVTLHNALKAYSAHKGCALQHLDVVPPSFAISRDPEECAALFGNYDDASQRNIPWVLKQQASIACPPVVDAELAPCTEASVPPTVVRGIAPIRKQFGQCTSGGNGPSLVVQRAVLEPLLIHSRRFKLHCIVLLLGTAPWVVRFSRGFVTLASSEARTIDSYAGSAVADSQVLERETTDPRRQATSTVASESSVWDHARFQRHLEFLGVCGGENKRKCDTMWARAKEICRLLIDATVFSSGSFSSDHAAPPPLTAFQLVRVSFWVNEALQPVLHRGSSDLGMLFDAAAGGDTSMTSFLVPLLIEAVALGTGLAKTGDLWEPLVDQYPEICEGKSEHTVDPCSSFLDPTVKPRLRETREAAKQTVQEVGEPASASAEQGRPDQVENGGMEGAMQGEEQAIKEENQETTTSESDKELQGAAVRPSQDQRRITILGPQDPRPAPRSPLSMQWRSPRRSPDEM